MMRKLLYLFLFPISKSLPKRLCTPSLGLLCIGMFFVFSSNYGQCGFGGSQSGTTQSIIYNRDNVSGNIGAVTFTGVPMGRYVGANVIQGLTYTITASSNQNFRKRITLYNAANTGTSLGTVDAGSNNGDASINWTATFTGTLYVRVNNRTSCTSTTGNNSTITVSYTGGNNTVDQANANAEGNNSWIAHVYDFSDSVAVNPLSDTNAFVNGSYLGYFLQGNTATGNGIGFSQDYGGGLTPNIPFLATGVSQPLFYGESFAVRYRMRSTLPAGCYFVTVRGDDGVRLYVDGVKVFDAWIQQGPTEYTNVLVYLNGNSQLLLDYYDKDEANVTDFSIYSADDTINSVNGINTAGPVYRCANSGNTVLDGSTITYQGGSTNPSIRFQWQSSTDNATWTDINTNGTGENYTVAGTNPASTTTVYYRRNITGTASNAGSCTYSTESIAVITSRNVTTSAPTPSAATNILCNDFTANWGAVTTASGYYLDVSTNSGFSSFVPGYSNLDVGPVTSYNVTGLNPNTLYYYRLRSYNKCSNNTSGSSASISATTTTSTANAGGALAAICQGAASAQMGGSVGGGATGGTWTGGAGTWANATNPSTAVYTAGASESGSITLTLTTSGGSCGTVTASKTITVNSNPTANAGGALAAICQGSPSAQMGGSVGGGATGGTWTGGAGTWANATNPSTARYTAGASESGSITLTLTTSGGSCGTTFVTKTITVNPNPTANAGTALAAICQGAASAQMGGSVGGGATGGTWTGGAGTWANATNPSTARYTAGSSESGSITLTLTTSGGSCGTTFVTKTITVNPNPTANAGTALAAICQGAASAQMGGSVGGGATGGTWTGGAGTWANATNPSTATYTAGASESGSITLRLTTSGGSCGTTFVTKTITVNPNPTANAGTALAAICLGSPSAQMGGSVGGGATGGTWTGGAGTWANATNPSTATYTAGASESGSITLTLTTSGGSCGTTFVTKTITVNPNPTANAGTALAAICQGAASAQMGGSVGGGATGGTWTGGAGTWANATNPSTARYTAGASESGSITLTLTTSGGSCGTTFVTKTITVNPNPTANAGTALAAICQGAASAQMGGSVGGGATGGTWTGGAGTWANATNPSTARYTAGSSESGSITLTLTTSGGSCGTTFVTKTITVNPNPTANAGTALAAICQGAASAQMGGSVGGGATGGTWTGGAGTWANATNPSTATYTAGASESGSITLRLTTSGGSCATTFVTKTITVNPNPTALSITKNNDVSCNSLGSITLTGLLGDWTVNQTGTTTSPKPYSGTTSTQLIEGLIAGRYYFTVTDNVSGCTSSSVFIDITDISSSTTWNGSGWSNGEPDGSKTAIISSVMPDQPFTAAKPNVRACTLIITVPTGSTVNVPKEVTLTITNAVTSNGRLVFESGSSLLQETNVQNTGNIVYKRATSIRRFDLTYWSSPVTKAGGFTMHDFSQTTLFDKYFYFNPSSGWTTNMNGTMAIETGIGYSIRGPQEFDTVTPSIFTGTFTGVPNNGDITVTGIPNNGVVTMPIIIDKFFLFGNPYPSAIDAEELLDTNKDVLGPLYFWTHATAPARPVGDNTYRYTSNDYTVFTLAGSTDITGLSSRPFAGKIAAGQGFIAKPKSTQIHFNNGMRVGGTNNGEFFKTAKTTSLEKNRIWLNIKNAEGAFKQILVGYIEGATNSVDFNYDATSVAGNTYIDFYSINETKKLTIQARALPFDNTDTVPLGYKTTVEGDFTIGIDHADGFFDKQEVYLEDKTTGKIINLRNENYTFKTLVGTFADRFALRYTSKTLGTGDFEDLESSVLISVKNKVVNITSSKETIKEVNVFNVGAQLLYSKNKVNSQELQINNLHSSDQVLLVKITLENGSTLTKKVIFTNL